MLKGMAALCVCVAFVSCSHDLEYDPNIANKQKELSYEQTFIKQFGQVSPTQDWDFTKVTTRTRAAEGEVASAIEEIPFDVDGFEWLWKPSKPEEGELNLNDFNNLWSKKNDIKKAIDAATPIPWDASKYQTVCFRTFVGCNDSGTYSYLKPYHRFGIHVPDANGGKNYWLAYADTKYTSWTTIGTEYMDHTRCLDFSKLPEGISWFVASQYSNKDQHKEAIYASEYKIQYFKEVVVEVTVKNKQYKETFWAFNCTGTGADNLILWVKTEAKHEDVITRKRYMAEDLGGNGDIDFNDVVFDVTDTNGKQKVSVRALGGTLDIAILIAGQEYWRKSTSADPNFIVKTMYNTGYNNTTIDYVDPLVEFEVSGWNPETNNVSVVVYGDGDEAKAETRIDFPIVGSIPRMIAVDVRKYWQKEKVRVPDMNWFYQLDEE